MNKLNPIFWKALNLKPSFWIERSLYRSWNIYNISQLNHQSINIGKRSLIPMQVEQILRRGAIYSPTLVKKSKNFWLPSKIMNCCPALDNNVLFSIASKEWSRCVNYLEPGIMAERCFLCHSISRMKVMFASLVHFFPWDSLGVVLIFYSQPNDCQF